MIAAALCLVGLGQPAFAIPSAGSEAVHGRPIQATGPLVIRDDSANGNIIATQLPVVSDLDSDNHIGWQYQWQVDGAVVVPPTQINNINAIPPYAPRANDGGKNAELIVRAIAEPRSFPTNTALSTEVRSTAFAIPYLPTSLPTANWLNHAGSIGSHTINGQSVTVSRSGEVNVLTSALPMGLCGGYPNYYTGAGTRLAETSAGGRLTLNFSRPIKNIKLAIVLTDVNEVFSFTTNATSAPVLTAYGTYNVAGTQITAARCRPPTVSGNTVTASGTTANDGSYTYYLNIGGDYFTQLTIANNGQGLVQGGAILFYNYSQASLGN